MKWVLSEPEVNKIEVNAKKLFPDENHVGRWGTVNIGIKMIKLDKVLTITKRKPGDKKSD